MGEQSVSATPENSDEESGDAFTDGDFGDSEEETVVERNLVKTAHMPINESVNSEIKVNSDIDCTDDSLDQANGVQEFADGKEENMHFGDFANCDSSSDLRRDSQSDGSIVGILGDQHSHVCNEV